ncbi:MAG: hypothetical protein LBS20_11690 [Prevotella sp.]|jgi:hypothetical protein|nr:hypothetical protein [Prevotella sp.]
MKIQLKYIGKDPAGYDLIPENKEEMLALGSLRHIYFFATGEDAMHLQGFETDREVMQYHGIETDNTDKYVTKMKFLRPKYKALYLDGQAAIEARITTGLILPEPTYRCTLCHSTEVRMKMWDNPNIPGSASSPSDDDDDRKNCYCNRCETHVPLELIPEEQKSTIPKPK